MTYISVVRPSKRKKHFKVHLSTELVPIRPLCGGGKDAKRWSGWQTDLAEANCKRCIKIHNKIVADWLKEQECPPASP